MSPVEDRIFLQHMIDAIDLVHEYVTSMTRQEFLEDKKTQDAVVRQLEIIGEAATNVSSNLTNAYSEVPWREMKAMRNRLIHGYFQVNLNIVWNVATREAPALRTSLVRIAQELSSR